MVLAHCKGVGAWGMWSSCASEKEKRAPRVKGLMVSTRRGKQGYEGLGSTLGMGGDESWREDLLNR